MAIQWNQRPTQLDFAPVAAALKRDLAQAAALSALAMEAEAKANAPWRDDTGAARTGLQGSSSASGNTITITLSHAMEYGQWLELKWPVDQPPPDLDGFDLEFLEAGRYAILWPTIEDELPRLKAAIERILGGG